MWIRSGDRREQDDGYDLPNSQLCALRYGSGCGLVGRRRYICQAEVSRASLTMHTFVLERLGSRLGPLGSVKVLWKDLTKEEPVAAELTRTAAELHEIEAFLSPFLP